MKVEVLGKSEVVHSIYVSTVSIGLRVIINLRGKHSHVHRCGFSDLYQNKHPDDAQKHQAFEVYEWAEDIWPACQIVLIPENESEKALIRNIEYSNVCKDQYVYLFINRDVINEGDVLAAYVWE